MTQRKAEQAHHKAHGQPHKKQDDPDRQKQQVQNESRLPSLELHTSMKRNGKTALAFSGEEIF